MMNRSIIIYILGWVIRLEGFFMLLPALVALFYRETAGAAYVFCSAVCLIAGWLITCKKPTNTIFYAREGFVTVALSWIVLSIIGALPLVISQEIPTMTDALFEIISGFTTTGASIIPNVEVLSRCNLFWRAFSHWIGGMGVLVFVLAVLPLAGGQSMYIMKAESPEPSVGKLVPKLQKTAFFLYAVYFAMTVLQFLLLVIARMPVFDAICTAFATAGTGGFGIKADSIAGYSPAIQTIITIFMFLFGVNFNFYFFLFILKPKDAFKMEEVRWYFAFFAASTLAITLNLTMSGADAFFNNLHHAAFQVSTIMTTTGFATADFNAWYSFSKAILVMLMFVGACAGSTGGGIKVSRILIYLKSAKKELSHLIHPRSIKILRPDEKPIPHEVLRSANTFLITYLVVFIGSILLISLDNFDLITNFTAVAATLNNIGPGLELVGPTGNFAMFSPFSKYILMFDMLAGRLEIFPMLLLFSASTWKKR